MEDLILLETIEKYLSNQMDAQEKTAFELVRKNTPEIDQMVVEHAMFLQQMDQFSAVKSIKQTLTQTHQNLLERGEISTSSEVPGGAKVIHLFHKYKRVASIAASVGGVIALFISGIALYHSPVRQNSQIQQLSNDIAAIKKNQQYQGKLINEVKSKLPAGVKFISGGSGFLIDAKGFIVTNAHVIKGTGAIVVDNTGKEYVAEIALIDQEKDLAILKIDDADYTSKKSLPYSIRKSTTDLGEEIFTLGYPRNEIVYGTGYLSARSGYEGDSLSYQLQMSANPGNSGAPVFDNDGEVIGVVSTREAHLEGVVFALKSNNIYKVVNDYNATNEDSKDIKISTRSNISRMSRKMQIATLESCVYYVKSFDK
jgi:S1-C subfamily serine protease